MPFRLNEPTHQHAPESPVRHAAPGDARKPRGINELAERPHLINKSWCINNLEKRGPILPSLARKNLKYFLRLVNVVNVVNVVLPK